MKKTYTKPEIMFEDFSLSVDIAAGCETKTDTQARGQCGLLSSGLNVFMSGMDACSDIAVDNVGGDGRYGKICYHVPFDSNNLFNS